MIGDATTNFIGVIITGEFFSKVVTIVVVVVLFDCPDKILHILTECHCSRVTKRARLTAIVIDRLIDQSTKMILYRWPCTEVFTSPSVQTSVNVEVYVQVRSSTLDTETACSATQGGAEQNTETRARGANRQAMVASGWEIGCCDEFLHIPSTCCIVCRVSSYRIGLLLRLSANLMRNWEESKLFVPHHDCPRTEVLQSNTPNTKTKQKQKTESTHLPFEAKCRKNRQEKILESNILPPRFTPKSQSTNRICRKPLICTHKIGS